MPTNLKSEYLSDEFFGLCAYAVKKAKDLGMLCWLYDEGGWPSGGACGKVLKDHPEFARELLKTRERSFSAGELYKKTTPDILAAFINDKEMIEEGYEFVSNSLSELKPVITADGNGLRAMHRKAENAELFFLFRECGDSGEYRVHLPSSKGYFLDLETEKLQSFEAENGFLNLSLSIGETAVIMLTDETFDADNKRQFSNKTDISDGFMLRKELELICGENGFENITHYEKSVSVNLGDWADIIGSDYSGSAVYEKLFVLSSEKQGKEGEIDLGEVRYAAELYLNRKPLGTALMSPYRLKIPTGVLDSNNKLKIVVTNTSADWYVHTDYFNKWNIKELSPYFEAELNYAKDLVSGGLYGPVTLYTE